MKDGMFVFDSVVHMLDMRPENIRTQTGDTASQMIQGFSNAWARPPAMPANDSLYPHVPTVEKAHRWVFEESDTDMVMVQTVPLMEYYERGAAPPDVQAEFAKAYPEKVLFCGGVDPLYQGVRGAMDEMERQVVELGARSIKFYQAQSRRMAWRADDERIAYPLYEKAQELGVTFLQFHKGLPQGDQLMEDLRALDIQGAALDFPDLTFGLHHLGDPYIDETIAAAQRFPNVVMVLPPMFNQYVLQPKRMLHWLGACLFGLGPDRLIFGSEGFLWPKLQTFIDMFAEMEMPEDLQEGWGFPPLDRETKEKIFGLNLARVMGIDVPAKLEELHGSGAGEHAEKARQE